MAAQTTGMRPDEAPGLYGFPKRRPGAALIGSRKKAQGVKRVSRKLPKPAPVPKQPARLY